MKRDIKINGDKVNVEIDAKFCQPHEKGHLLPVFECKAIAPKVYDKLLKFIVDLNGQVKTSEMTFQAKEWFDKSFKLAEEIKNADENGILNGIAYKMGDNKKYQLIACWYYLAGVRKAPVNYALAKLGLRASKYAKETLKEVSFKILDPEKKSLPKKVTPVTVKSKTVKKVSVKKPIPEKVTVNV